MKAEEFNAFFKEKQKKNPDTVYLMQLSLANYYCNNEQLEWISEVMDTKMQLLFLMLLVEEYPMELLKEASSLQPDEAKRRILDYLYERDGLTKKNEKISQQIEHLKNMVEATKTMEEYLKVIVTQKDRMLKSQEEQINSLNQHISEIKQSFKEKEEFYSKIRSSSCETETGNMIREKKQEFQSQDEMLPVKTMPVKKSCFHRFSRKRQREEAYLFLDYLKEENWSMEQTDFLLKCQKEGMSVEELKRISSPDYSLERMELLKRILKTME